VRAFRIGYILTLSFLLVLMVVTLTFGYYSAPKGPKAPEYPAGSSLSSTYQTEYDQYQKDRKKYEDQQEGFLQEKIVPYARNVFVIWIIFLLIFQVVGIVIARFGSALVGAGFSFSGFWAVVFGPLGGLLWFVNSLVSSFGRAAEQQFNPEPILQAIGITSLIGVVVISMLGTLFYGKIKDIVMPTPPSS